MYMSVPRRDTTATAAQLVSLGFEEPRGVKRSRDQRAAAKCNCIHGDSMDMHFP